MANIIPILLFIFWLPHIQRRFLNLLYFWQLKSYRIDRVLEEIGRDKRIIFPRIYIPVLALLPFLFLIQTVAVFDYLLLFIYFIFGSYSLLLFLRKRWKFPIFTKKILIIFIFIFLFWIFLIFYFWQKMIFFIPVFEILLPLFIFSCLGMIEIPAVILKRLAMKRAKNKREMFKNLVVIGITGSYGKSSTKEFLYSILSQKYSEHEILKTEKNINTEIGVSNTILKNLNSAHKFFICEIGAYRIGEIKTVCKIVKPKIGILTGINEQHMATFGSQENIIKAKYELIESLPEGRLPDGSQGIAFFNAKNKYCAELFNETLRLRSGQTQFKGILYGQDAKFFGEENILGAMAVAKELGMTDEEIQKAVSKIENKMPGIMIKRGVNGLTMIDSTYSANPDGVIANLEYLKNNFKGKKIIVMPCLIELGQTSAEVHRRIGKKIAEICDLAIITTKDRFAEIKSEAGDKAIFMDNSREIFEKINEFAKEGDVVLLESRVPKELIKQLTINN